MVDENDIFGLIFRLRGGLSRSQHGMLHEGYGRRPCEPLISHLSCCNHYLLNRMSLTGYSAVLMLEQSYLLVCNCSSLVFPFLRSLTSNLLNVAESYHETVANALRYIMRESDSCDPPENAHKCLLI